MPAHHKLEAFLDEYLRTAGIAGDERMPGNGNYGVSEKWRCARKKTPPP
jgi:hypothetical protein